MEVASILGLVAAGAVAGGTASAVLGFLGVREQHELWRTRRAPNVETVKKRRRAGWLIVCILSVGSGACAFGIARHLTQDLTEQRSTGAVHESHSR